MRFIKPTLVALIISSTVYGLDTDLTDVAKGNLNTSDEKAKILADVEDFGYKLKEKQDSDIKEYKNFVDEAIVSSISKEKQNNLYDDFKKSVKNFSEVKYTMDKEYNLTKVDENKTDTQIESLETSFRPRIVYFASRSMGDIELSNLLEQASLTKHSLVVFRGFEKGIKSIDLGTKWLYSMLSEMIESKRLKTVPAVVIDPVLFDEYKIDKVPAMVLIKESGWDVKEGERLKDEVSAKDDIDSIVFGLTDAKWLYDKKEKGEVGNFGIKAKVFDISEPDLIQVMQEQARNYDWDSMQKRAIENMWTKYEFETLPAATKTRVRNIDLTVTVPRDIKNEEGVVLFPKGMKVNPFEYKAFDFALIVYNPTRKGEFKVVEEQMKRLQAKEGVNNIILIATEIDRVTGSDDIIKIEDKLQKPFFLNKPEITKRFNLEYTPSVVELTDGKVTVSEIALSDSDITNKKATKTEKSRASVDLPEVVTDDEIDEINHVKPRFEK